MVDAAGPPGRRGRGRRAHHRRRRPRPLPRPGEGRREVRPVPDPRLGSRLPQRRPRALRAGRAGLPGPRRRPGEGRRSPHRARRDRGGAARTCPGSPAAPVAVRETAAGNQVLVGYLAVPDPAAFDRAAAMARLRERAARGARPAARRGRRAARAHLGQGRPGRAAVAAAGRASGSMPLTTRHWSRAPAAPGAAVAGGARHPGDRRELPTSSTSAADRSPPRSWSRASARTTRSSRSPRSTRIRGSARWPTRSPRGSRRPAPSTGRRRDRLPRASSTA